MISIVFSVSGIDVLIWFLKWQADHIPPYAQREMLCAEKKLAFGAC